MTVEHHASAALPPRKKPSTTQSRSGRFGKGKITCSYRHSNPGPSSHAIPAPVIVAVTHLTCIRQVPGTPAILIEVFGCCALLLLLPLALQPAVGFGLSNNTSPFVLTYHPLSPSSHSQHLEISFHFSPSLPGSSSSSRPFHFLSEDVFGHPILLHSLQVTKPAYPLPLYPFYYIFSFIQLF